MYRFALIWILFLTALYGNEGNAVVVEETQASYIKVSDVSSSSADVLTELKTSSKSLEPQKEVVKIGEELSPYIKDIDKLLSKPENRYLQYISAKELAIKEQIWQTQINQLTNWNARLEKRTKEFDKQRVYLEKLLKTWEETLINAKKEKAPKLVIENISNVIKSIKKVKLAAKKRYDKILTELTFINKKILEINDIL